MPEEEDNKDDLSPEPPKEPKAEEEETELDGGLYFHLEGAALFAPTGATHSWGTDGCPSLTIPELNINWNPNCAAKAPIGGAITARLGFRYKYVGFELLGIGAGDWSSATYDEPVPGVPTIATSMQVGRVGGGPGAGLRFMTRPSTFRFSAGLGAAALFRYVFTSFSSLDGSSTNYVAPALISDVNLMIGPLSLGVLAMVEFSKDVNVQTNLNDQIFIPNQETIDVDAAFSPIRVFTGTQFFLGPVIGLHFGE